MMDLVPVFPLGSTYLPGEMVVLRVFEERYIAMLHDLSQFHNSFVTVLIAQGSEVGGQDRRFTYGVRVAMAQIAQSETGYLLQGIATDRVRIDSWGNEFVYPSAHISTLSDDSLTASQCHDAASSLTLVAQNVRTLHERIATYEQRNDQARQPMPLLATIAGGRWWDTSIQQAEIIRAYWAVAAVTPCGPLDRYELLQPDSLLERIKRLRAIVEHVTEVMTFQMGY